MATKPYIQANQIADFEKRGQAYRIRVEYHGTTEKGNTSSKFWEIEVEANSTKGFATFGRIGGTPSAPLSYDKGKALKLLQEKFAKGYRYAETVKAPQEENSFIASIASIRAREDGNFDALDSGGNLFVILPPDSASEVASILEGRTTSSMPSPAPESNDFDRLLKEYLAQVQDRINDHYAKTLSNLTPPTLKTEPGRKYIRIVKDGSAFGFVNRENGDLLKAESWKTPAKGARGNLYVRDSWSGSHTPWGMSYNYR